MASGLYAGLHAASVINDTAVDATASAITGIGTMALSDNVALGVATGSSQYLLSKFGNILPFVGSYVEDVTSRINSAENYLCIGSAGLAIAGVSVLGTLASKGIKGIVNKVKNKQAVKDSNETLKEDILKRIEDAKENTSEELEKRTNKQVILDIVCDELRMDDIDIPYNLQDTFELKTILQTQPLKKKMRALNVMNTLNKIEKDNNRTFKDRIKDYAKYAYYGGILTLAGLGAYDRFFNNGFLKNLRFNIEDLENQKKEETKKLMTKIKNINGGINDIVEGDLSMDPNSDMYKIAAMGFDEVHEPIIKTLEANGGKLDYNDFVVDKETKAWMTEKNFAEVSEVLNYASNLDLPDSAYIEMAKEENKIIGDFLAENTVSRNIFEKIWKSVEIDWENMHLTSEVSEALISEGMEPSVEGVKKWLGLFETDVAKVKYNNHLFPTELVEVAVKTEGTEFKEEDLESIFHEEAQKAIVEMGYKDPYEFVDAIQNVDLKVLREEIPIISENATSNEVEEIITTVQNDPKMNMLFYTPIGKEMKEALETIGKINAIEAAKDYLESVKIKSPYKVFGVGAVAGTIANGIKSLFTRKSKKVPELPEAKAGENNEKENFENSIKVDLNDSQVVDDSNIQEAKDEVEEKGKGKDEEK